VQNLLRGGGAAFEPQPKTMPLYFELVTKFLFAARDFNRPVQ
jgi:hypothetical protein